MNNFIIGILVGMALFGVIVIIVDQLRGRGWNINTNPIDIFSGFAMWVWDKANESAKKVAQRRVDMEFEDEEEYYGRHEKWSRERLDAVDAIFEVEEEEEYDEDVDMELINRMVEFCEGKG